MRSDVILLVMFASAPVAAAQIVHPNQYATTEGVANNSYPFNYSSGAGHYQQSYDASQFPGPRVITEIAFRYIGDATYAAGAVDFKLTLAYCATSWNALGSTYANNIGTGATVVHDGIWNFAAFSGDPATPNPFTVRLPLTNPFVYDPGAGDLLMDMEIRSSASSSSGGAFERADVNLGVWRVYSNDGNPTGATGTVGSNGLITEFTEGAVATYGAGCAGAGGFVPALFLSGFPGLGQQVLLTLDNGLGGAQSITMIGAAQASTPIGGGCTLLVQPPVLQVFIPLGGVGPGNGSYALPGIIPLTSPLGTVYFQSFVADPSTPTGFSASNGLRADIQ